MLIYYPGATCKEIPVAMPICKGHGPVEAAWEALRAGDTWAVSGCPSHMGWNSFWECFKKPIPPQAQGDFH